MRPARRAAAATAIMAAAIAASWAPPAVADADVEEPVLQAEVPVVLNLRDGPGTEHAVVGRLEAGEVVEIRGCLEDWRWCAVTADQGRGWASAKFLQTRFHGRPFRVADVGDRVGIPVVLYKPDEPGQIVGRDGPLPDADLDEAATGDIVAD